MTAPILGKRTNTYTEDSMKLGAAVCEACGLDPSGVRGITINIPAGDLVTVDVTLVVGNPLALLSALDSLRELNPLDSVNVLYEPDKENV